MTVEKSRRRLQLETDRIDFLGPLTKPSSGVSEEEFTSNASSLILAGSETTATLLSGATFHLLKSPGPLAKLVEEVRSSFSSEEEIDLVGVNGLKYMLACLDESLRMYPPVPAGFPRRVPEGGATIAGKWVPEQVCERSPGGSLGDCKAEALAWYQTVVTVTQWAAYHSPRNFYLPNEFIPERWLGDPRFNDDNKAVLQPFHVGPRNCLGRK
jgi:cytochrome P450